MVRHDRVSKTLGNRYAEGVPLKAVKRINNNAVMCLDAKGRNVVAFGKGIAFAVDKKTGDLPLSSIERTFYNIDKHYLALLDELSPELLAISARIVDIASASLPYDLAPTAVISLADHISFAINRLNGGIDVKMPIAYDVRQMYPTEYEIGEIAVDLINRRMGLELPDSEIVGIALSIFNASVALRDDASTKTRDEDDKTIEDVVSLIEGRYQSHIDRDGFEFSRFATHVRHLFGRLRSGEPMEAGNDQLYQTARDVSVRGKAALDDVVDLLEERFGTELTEAEKLYLLMHIHRLGHPRKNN